jgi:hypothetical protein
MTDITPDCIKEYFTFSSYWPEKRNKRRLLYSTRIILIQLTSEFQAGADVRSWHNHQPPQMAFSPVNYPTAIPITFAPNHC